MTARATGPAASPVTAASHAFVAAHIDAARALGRSLADHVDEPATFVDAMRSGLESLADPVYLAGQRLVAPGIGPLLGVRLPLLEAVHRALTRELRGVRAVPGSSRSRKRWHATRSASCAGSPAGSSAACCPTIRSSPGRCSAGSPRTRTTGSPWTRWPPRSQRASSSSRIAGRSWSSWSTAPAAGSAGSSARPWPRSRSWTATAGGPAEVVSSGLALVGLLIGDPEPDVQKALSWALRNLTIVDPGPVTAFCRRRGGARRRDGRRRRERGSSATRWRSSHRPRRPSFARCSPASAGRRAPPTRRPLPRPPPPSQPGRGARVPPLPKPPLT